MNLQSRLIDFPDLENVDATFSKLENFVIDFSIEILKTKMIVLLIKLIYFCTIFMIMPHKLFLLLEIKKLKKKLQSPKMKSKN